MTALLSKVFTESGYSVLAIDADPNPNLAATLGFPHAEEITPISEMKDLIEDRTGAQPDKTGSFFKLNPKVDDLPEKYWREHDGIKLMVMGYVKRGGSGCYCPESTILQALVSHLLLARNEVVIMDMEAGIEHLSRATARAVDSLIIVVEPGRRSIETAARIKTLAQDIGIQNIVVVGNRIRSQADREFLLSSLPEFKFIGFIPYDQAVVAADLANAPVVAASSLVIDSVQDIYKAIVNTDKSRE